MSEHDKPDLNVYGHNLPPERGRTESGVRNEGVGEHLDETRKERREGGGGMGRSAAPKDGPAEGKWRHDDRRAADSEVHALDERPELEETPMPPRHAPLSDEEPS